MLLSRLLANFTRGESDTLRKAMGKKMKDKLDELMPKFLGGGKKNGHDEAVLKKIWSDWEAFASYAFNKSHATCYSWVAYQTAWLKANFPSQFMAGTMSRALDNISDITKLMEECKVMKIDVLGPDINESRLKFSVNHCGQIRFGLGAIKGVGANVVESIVAERQKNGNFRDIFDFLERVNLSLVNRKALECLALAGAFDCFEDIRREQYLAPCGANGAPYADVLMNYAQKFQADKAFSQASLFGDMAEVEIDKPQPPAVYARWSDIERLNRERDLVGIYISGHPLDEYQVIIQKVCSLQAQELADLTSRVGHDVTFGGIVSGVRGGQSKNGKPYGIVKIEDYSGAGEIALFGDDWAKWHGYFQQGNSLFITARIEPRKYRQDEVDLRIGKIEWLSDVKDTKIRNICITADIHSLSDAIVEELYETMQQNPGQTEVLINLVDHLNNYVLHTRSLAAKVNVGKAFMAFLDGTEGLEYHIND